MKSIRISGCRGMVVAAMAMYMAAVAASLAHADGTLGGAGDPFEIFFDENGNGRISVNGGPFSAISGVMAPDPASGMLALTYFLPELVTNGDVGVFSPSENLSDGMRFTNANGDLRHDQHTADRMLYFSELDQGETNPEKADTGFPPNFPGSLGFNGTVDEVGPEGNNGFNWFPGGNVYHGISDVPEPSTVALMGIGLVGLTAYCWRRRRQVA